MRGGRGGGVERREGKGAVPPIMCQIVRDVNNHDKIWLKHNCFELFQEYQLSLECVNIIPRSLLLHTLIFHLVVKII